MLAGSWEMAELARMNALGVAVQLARLDQAIVIANRLFAQANQSTDLLAKLGPGFIGLTIRALMEAGREQDALLLAQRLKKSGWPNAAETADDVIQSVSGR